MQAELLCKVLHDSMPTTQGKTPSGLPGFPADCQPKIANQCMKYQANAYRIFSTRPCAYSKLKGHSPDQSLTRLTPKTWPDGGVRGGVPDVTNYPPGKSLDVNGFEKSNHQFMVEEKTAFIRMGRTQGFASWVRRSTNRGIQRSPCPAIRLVDGRSPNFCTCCRDGACGKCTRALSIQLILEPD